MAVTYRETISYGELARRVGRPEAARAVGWANGRNPLSIIVPCHRVVGARGALTGYGGGLERKRLLLALSAAGLGDRAATCHDGQMKLVVDRPPPRAGRRPLSRR